ncbi:HAD family hydrolase [Marinomonas epiphytica]
MSVLITFDLDNTLWDVEPVIQRAEYAMESWFEERFPGLYEQYPVTTQFELRKDVLLEQPDLKTNLTALRLAVYLRLLKHYGLPSEEANMVAEAALAHFTEWRQRVDLFPHAQDVLRDLYSDYKLAVITNGNADVFHPYVGLGQYFEFAQRADQMGIAKPDKGIFQRVADRAGVAVESIIHIGDHPIDDVYGAANAGAKSIWFNRHGARRWNEEWPASADAEVYSLLELPGAISSLLS